MPPMPPMPSMPSMPSMLRMQLTSARHGCGDRHHDASAPLVSPWIAARTATSGSVLPDPKSRQIWRSCPRPHARNAHSGRNGNRASPARRCIIFVWRDWPRRFRPRTVPLARRPFVGLVSVRGHSWPNVTTPGRICPPDIRLLAAHDIGCPSRTHGRITGRMPQSPILPRVGRHNAGMCQSPVRRQSGHERPSHPKRRTKWPRLAGSICRPALTCCLDQISLCWIAA